MKDHIEYANGKAKTVCVTTVLVALGVPFDGFKYTWNGKKNIWPEILRRAGYAVRSRASRLPRVCTVGKSRAIIAAMDDAPGTMYAVTVRTVAGSHLMLLNDKGQTVVDTAPRHRDARRIAKISAIIPN